MNQQQNPNNKRILDLPNLTQCQSCGYRIDICNIATNNGKNHNNNNNNNNKRILRTLYSEWRILLVCNDCTSLIESSRICSYCFKECNNSDCCFRCGECNRSVHKNCFFDQKWMPSSCRRSEEFIVCVDCWLPESIARSRRGKKRRCRILDEGKDGDHLEVGKKSRNHMALALAERTKFLGRVFARRGLKSGSFYGKLCDQVNGLTGRVYVRNRSRNGSNFYEKLCDQVNGLTWRAYARRRLRNGSNFYDKLCDEVNGLTGRVYARNRLRNGSNFYEKLCDEVKNSKNLSMLGSKCFDSPRTGESYDEHSVSAEAQNCDSSAKVANSRLCTRVYYRRRLGHFKQCRRVYMRMRLKKFKHLKESDNQVIVFDNLLKMEEEDNLNKLKSSTINDISRACDETRGEKHDRYLLKYRKRKLG
ncbi:hypothetical protein ACFE04_001443 [Oxalis oulophora]